MGDGLEDPSDFTWDSKVIRHRISYKMEVCGTDLDVCVFLFPGASGVLSGEVPLVPNLGVGYRFVTESNVVTKCRSEVDKKG